MPQLQLQSISLGFSLTPPFSRELSISCQIRVHPHPRDLVRPLCYIVSKFLEQYTQE